MRPICHAAASVLSQVSVSDGFTVVAWPAQRARNGEELVQRAIRGVESDVAIHVVLTPLSDVAEGVSIARDVAELNGASRLNRATDAIVFVAWNADGTDEPVRRFLDEVAKFPVRTIAGVVLLDPRLPRGGRAWTDATSFASYLDAVLLTLTRVPDGGKWQAVAEEIVAMARKGDGSPFVHVASSAHNWSSSKKDALRH